METLIFCADFYRLPWTLDDFLDKNYKSIRESAVVNSIRSLLIYCSMVSICLITCFQLQIFNDLSMKVRDLIDELIMTISTTGSQIGKNIIIEFELDTHLPILAESKCHFFMHKIYILFWIVIQI